MHAVCLVVYVNDILKYDICKYDIRSNLILSFHLTLKFPNNSRLITGGADGSVRLFAGYDDEDPVNIDHHQGAVTWHSLPTHPNPNP